MMDMDNIIISGVRIYFPPDGVLPNPSEDMLTFAIVRDEDVLKECFLLIHKKGRWQIASPQLYSDAGCAIMAATKIGKKFWQ